MLPEPHDEKRRVIRAVRLGLFLGAFLVLAGRFPRKTDRSEGPI